MENISIGIDIGGTNTAIGIVDLKGKILVKKSFCTTQTKEPKLFVKEITTSIKELCTRLNFEYYILGIGIGAPNANYYKGTIEHAANLPFKGIIPLVDMFRSEFPEIQTIVMTNDANAATLGEMIYGGAKGMKDFVMYTLGTGVGSGIVSNSQLVYGKNSFAGECGHNMLIPDGRCCGCGINGHIEAYCSASGMKRTAFELLTYYNDNNSPLASKSFRELNSKDIYEAAVAGDAIAMEVFELTGKYLGMAMASTVHTTGPEAIFLFGGITAAGKLILEPTQRFLNQYLLPTFKGTIPIKISELNLGDAAIVGACSLVLKEITK